MKIKCLHKLKNKENVVYKYSIKIFIFLSLLLFAFQNIGCGSSPQSVTKTPTTVDGTAINSENICGIIIEDTNISKPIKDIMHPKIKTTKPIVYIP